MLLTTYEEMARREMEAWKFDMQRSPNLLNRFSKKMQDKVNSFIPDKIHEAITTTLKQMIRAVLFGSEKITAKPTANQLTLEEREATVFQRIKIYQHVGAAEGGITGAGGILLGLADFPLLLSLKLKLLYEIAAQYGHNTSDYKERLYLLYIFQLAFSSQQQRRQVFRHIAHWEMQKHALPEDINQFDWRTFQQEYRDYIDLAKMAQLVPVIGAPVGAIANYHLLKKLGNTAINAYRMRWFAEEELKRLK
jgi:hypothetical protein